MLVEVAYPAPLLFVPKGARNERIGYCEQKTSVHLREADRPDLVEVTRARAKQLSDPEPIYAFDGALWREARAPGGNRSSAAALFEFLGGGAGARRQFTIREHFARTPLAFETLKAMDPDRAVADPDRIRTVTVDGRLGAEARVADFAGSDLLLAGDAAYLRCRPVLGAGLSRRTATRQQDLQIAPGLYRTGELRTVPDPYSCEDYQQYVGCPDHADAFHAYLVAHTQNRYLGVGGDPKVPDYGLPRGHHGDGDIRLMANVVPEMVLGRVRYGIASLAARGLDQSPLGAYLEAARAELQPYVVLGHVGGVHLQDAQGLIERCVEISGRADEADRSPHAIGNTDALPVWYDLLGRARLAEIANAVPREDVEAFTQLAP